MTTTTDVAIEAAVWAAVFLVSGLGLAVGFSLAAFLQALVDASLHWREWLRIKREHARRESEIRLESIRRFDVMLPAPARSDFLRACLRAGGPDVRYLPSAKALGIPEQEWREAIRRLNGSVSIVNGRPPAGAMSNARINGNKTLGELLM